MVEYDAKIIQKFATKLYSQANTIVAVWTILGAIVGGIAGAAMRGRDRDSILVIAGVIVVGFLGYLIGQVRAFMLRLQAQTALCQLQIERNTRNSSA